MAAKIGFPHIFAVIFLAIFITWVNGQFECMEALCGPRVSKCMLLKSCNCSMTPADMKAKNCSCCKECITCLADQLTDCCSCVGLCPGKKNLDPSLKMKSIVEDLNPDEEDQELFRLIAEPEEEGQLKTFSKGGWNIHTFPALQESKFFYKTQETESVETEYWKGINCTVLYGDNCMPSEECAKACISLGSSSYRWFLTGCCECVGEDCINFGSREGRCKNCLDIEEEAAAKRKGEL